MTLPKKGEKIPYFKGEDQNGKVISSDSVLGKKVILYFYPKDSTPGCTAEACNLKDNYNLWIKNGYSIFGISIDSKESHKKFIAKNNLPFDLISDESKEIVQAFGVWGTKKMYGREYLGTFRTTFVINEEGIIENIIEKVNTKKHSEQILKELK